MTEMTREEESQLRVQMAEEAAMIARYEDSMADDHYTDEDTGETVMWNGQRFTVDPDDAGANLRDSYCADMGFVGSFSFIPVLDDICF